VAGSEVTGDSVLRAFTDVAPQQLSVGLKPKNDFEQFAVLKGFP
jgi:hypothetical protein